MKIQKVDFQNQAGGANFRKTEAQVYLLVHANRIFGNWLQMRCRIRYNALHRYQSPLFELPNL